MALFMAASDESKGKTHRDPYACCGVLAPVDDWIAFTERWDTRVLAGPPRIPYLHMTEIRSKSFRAKWELSDVDAERRVDEACALIGGTPSLTPIGGEINAGRVYDTFTKKVLMTSGAAKKFVPDYLAFMNYAYLVILYCHRYKPEAEKVDFMVEKNGEITDHISEFYKGMESALEYNGLSKLIPLVGNLIPVNKDRAPVQVADVFCWHDQRAKLKNLDEDGARRYLAIADREGFRVDFDDAYVTELWESVKDGPPNGVEKPRISEIRSNDEENPGA